MDIAKKDYDDHHSNLAKVQKVAKFYVNVVLYRKPGSKTKSFFSISNMTMIWKSIRRF